MDISTLLWQSGFFEDEKIWTWQFLHNIWACGIQSKQEYRLSTYTTKRAFPRLQRFGEASVMQKDEARSPPAGATPFLFTLCPFKPVLLQLCIWRLRTKSLSSNVWTSYFFLKTCVILKFLKSCSVLNVSIYCSETIAIRTIAIWKFAIPTIVIRTVEIREWDSDFWDLDNWDFLEFQFSESQMSGF